MLKLGVLCSCAFVLVVSGCSSPATNEVKAPTSAIPGQTATATGGQTAPVLQEPITGGVATDTLAKYKTDYDTAKAAYAKNPRKKKDYVDSTVRLATATMMADNLGPKEKYPGALKLYREALKIDPTNSEASHNKDLIESIYKQMGRPIPQ